MPEQTHIQRLRGNTKKSDGYTGLDGEITINSETHSLRIHDGETEGGFGTVCTAHYDVLPTVVPNDLRDDAIVTSGTGPLTGADVTVLLCKIQELEARLDALVVAKEVAAYDNLPATVPSDLADDALVITGTGALA